MLFYNYPVLDIVATTAFCGT